MFFRSNKHSKKKQTLFATIPATVDVSTKTLLDDVSTQILPATTKRRRTTGIHTMLTTPRTGMVSHGPPSAAEDGRFIITAMSVVVGFVFIVIMIIIIAFLLKSRRRRIWNVRIYRDNQQRHAATASVEVIDGDDHSHTAINGVHQAIYGQDSRLPIRMFGHTEKSSTQQGGTNTTSSQSASQNVGSSQTSKEIVYENNGAIVKPNPAPVCGHPVQSGLNDEINKLEKRLQTQRLNQEQHSDGHYENAFSELGKQIKSNSPIENKKKAVPSTSVLINKCTTTDDCLTNKNHTRATTIGNEIQNLKGVNIGPEQTKERPKIKPKPVLLNGKQNINKQTIREARLLKTIPPPCNTNTYTSNGEENKSASENSLLRQSSEYEDLANVLALKKQAEDGLDHCDNGHALKPQENPKSDYANIAMQRKQDPKKTESVAYDYENSCAVNELKLKKKIVGKRSFSASSLGSRTYANIRTGPINVHEMRSSLLKKENDEMYLPMDMATMNEDMYLPMDLDTSTDDVYLSMGVTVDDVYMPMERTDSYTESDSSSTKLLHNSDIGNLRAPKPCGGRVAYVNISDQQSQYVNLYRSRSTDDIYTCVDYMNFKSCTDLTRKERQTFK